jgi:hypothetical protein
MTATHHIDWERFDALQAEGLSFRRISEAMGVPRTTLQLRLAERKSVQNSRNPESYPLSQSQQISTLRNLENSMSRHTDTLEVKKGLALSASASEALDLLHYELRKLAGPGRKSWVSEGRIISTLLELASEDFQKQGQCYELARKLLPQS